MSGIFKIRSKVAGQLRCPGSDREVSNAEQVDAAGACSITNAAYRRLSVMVSKGKKSIARICPRLAVAGHDIDDGAGAWQGGWGFPGGMRRYHRPGDTPRPYGGPAPHS